MTDHELCLAAAKAAGYLTETWEGNEAYIAGMMSRWHPLENDGDAFRLMVDCGLQVECWPTRAIVYDTDNRLTPDYRPTEEDYGTDKHAATRRAIVRAAAAMGESL